MRVITLDNEAFDRACRRLEEMTTGFDPDVVVGIANGGVEVARRMHTSLPHLTVRARRPSTEAKDRHGRAMAAVRRLPRWLKNAMRMAESYILSKRCPEVPIIELNAADFAGYRRILVVDDAVDSGATARGVVDAIRRLPSQPSLALAVVTVTTPHPIVDVDFALYTNRTLIRFPWSKDN